MEPSEADPLCAFDERRATHARRRRDKKRSFEKNDALVRKKNVKVRDVLMTKRRVWKSCAGALPMASSEPDAAAARVRSPLYAKARAPRGWYPLQARPASADAGCLESGWEFVPRATPDGLFRRVLDRLGTWTRTRTSSPRRDDDPVDT